MSSVRRFIVQLFQPDITGNEIVDRLFRAVANRLNPVLSNALIQGAIIENVDLSTGVNKVPHGLGRKARYFFAVTATAGTMGNIYNDQANNPDPSRTIWVGLETSPSSTVTLLVFS